MGKGKARTKATVEDAAVSASPSVFKTIFGDVSEENAGVSIFSDGNPFRRKPKETENVGNIGSPDVGDVRKRKRGEETKNESFLSSVIGESETPSQLGKSRKKKLHVPDSVDGSCEEGNERNPNLDSFVETRTKKEKGRIGEGNNHDSDLRLITTGGRSDSYLRDPEGGGKEAANKGVILHKGKRKRDELEKEYETRKYGVVREAENSLGRKIVGEKRKVVDKPADLLVSKDGFDDEDKLLRTVFVGNLPLKVKKKALLKEFSQCGEVESVRIRSVAVTDSKLSRKGAIITKQINDSVDSVHAYIVFKTEESAHASLSHNMAVFAGNHIRVDRACPPRKKLKSENAPIYDHKRTVFVGNLPFDVKDEELYQLFCGIDTIGSSVEAVRVIRDPHTNLGKGFAYVLFKTRQSANIISKRRNLKLRDRELRLFHAKPNLTPSKRQDESTPPSGASPAKIARRDSFGVEKTKSELSYQGLRASKSGVQKKISMKKVVPERLKSNPKEEKRKVRIEKRPAVAARKAKANAMSDRVLSSKPSEMKRKLESRTPESSRPMKKAKKFR